MKIQITQKHFFQIWHLLYSDYIETSSLNIFLISPLHPKQRATLWVIFFRPRGTFWPGAAPVVDISTQNLIKPAHQPCRPLHLSNNKHVRAFSLHSRWFFITQTCILKMTCDLCLFDLVCVCANVFVLDSKCKCLLAKMCIVYVISAFQWQWAAIKYLKQHKTRIKSAGLCLYWCFLSQVETCPLVTRDMVVCSQWHWLCVIIEACHCCFLPLQCAHMKLVGIRLRFVELLSCVWCHVFYYFGTSYRALTRK